MSNLHKQIFLKGKPPVPTQKTTKNDESDSGDEEEEKKDTFDPVTKMPGFSGPIKVTEKITKPDDLQIPKSKKPSNEYAPSSWNEYFDEHELLEDGTSVFIAGGEKGPAYVCLHGAGHSAQSFACLAGEIKKFATAIAFDFRGHGMNKVEKDVNDLSIETLIKDTLNVLEYVNKKFPELTIIVVGHSMGGSVACKTTEIALKTDIASKIQGLIVIDVVEGTAIEALPFMEGIVKSMPKSFQNVESAVQWATKSGTIKNLQSARVSIPDQLVEKEGPKGKYFGWKVDLMASQDYWMACFKGLTQSFLNIQIPKILLLAGAERMDKELTIAQMQGRFRLKVVDAGHSIQEDNWKETVKICYDFIKIFRLPLTTIEMDHLKEQGVGKFHPNLPKNPFE